MNHLAYRGVCQALGVGAQPVVVVVDVANVMGSRPDGWWRDRAGAAGRLVAALDGLPGREVGTAGRSLQVTDVVAVVEGAARAVADASAPASGDADRAAVRIVRAPADGDTTIAAEADALAAAGSVVLVVTSDRGLRARLADGVLVEGSGWLNRQLGR